MSTLGSQLPREGKAAEVAHRIGLVVLSPLIYLALAFTALAGLISNGFWEKKHLSELKAQYQDGVAKLVKETEVFGALKPKTELEKASQVPEGAFGKEEWENSFPVTVEEVPPLPANIHEILEQADPCEPGKKMRETCMLFLRPKKVILHEEGGDKELPISFDGVEELAKKAADPARRAHYQTFDGLRAQMNGMPVADSGWVLMRKEVIPGSRNLSFENQIGLLQGNFEVPKLMDAILLNILTYASEGMCLYGINPVTYTRCQEMHTDHQIIVGAFDSSGLNVDCSILGYDNGGLSGTWKF